MPDLGAQHILLLERQPSVARIIRRCLATAGYTVKETPDMDSLPRMCGEKDCGLVLASLGSLGPSPLDAIVRIRKAGVPLLLMTGGADQEVIDAAISLGARGPLGKPFTPDGLLAMVRDILR